MKAADPSGHTLRARGVLGLGVFELGRRSDDLRKNRLRLKLSRRPFQLLTHDCDGCHKAGDWLWRTSVRMRWAWSGVKVRRA